MRDFNSELSEKIISEIEDFVKTDKANRMVHLDNERIFSEPLVGFAGGSDPLFARYRDIIGYFHLTPLEWLEKLQGDKENKEEREDKETIAGGFSADMAAENVTVISWILPISEKTRRSNVREDKIPSRAWAHTRNCGEKFNNRLREQVVMYLRNEGYQAVAPMLRDEFARKESPRSGMASNWSERHAAYAAGLGTFGLCDGLITPAGKAMRCGSVIAGVRLKPTARKYSSHQQHCSFLSGNSCGKCRERCPAGAITEEGHDKEQCSFYQQEYIDPASYGVEIAGCGLCQTDVPCEAGIPEI